MIDRTTTVARLRAAQRNSSMYSLSFTILAALAIVVGLMTVGGAGQAAATPPPSYLYAAPSATGTGNCLSAANACSLQDALLAATPGSTVRLTSAGDAADPSTYYVGNWTVNTAGTSAGAPVTITPAPGVTAPVLDGDGTLGATCSTATCTSSVLTIASGVYANVSAVTIQDANAGTGRGGGIDVAGGNLTVARTTFRNNVVTGFTSDGGAISANGGGTATVSRSSFDSNSSSYFGGAIGVGVGSTTGTVTVTASTFVGNTAGYDGVAVSVGSFYGSGDLTVISSTFSGGNVYSLGYNGGGGTITEAANVFDGYCAIDPTQITDAGYNVGLDAGCENGGPGDDASLPTGSPRSPALAAPADNGGATATMALRKIMPNPAIRAIPANTSVTISGAPVALCPAVDQRGVTNNSADGCHAGAAQLLQALAVPPKYLYAAPVAAGVGDCTSGADACTLEDALIAAGPGTTVRLTSAGQTADPSTYYVGNWTVATSGTTASKPVTITAAPGVRNPVLDGDLNLGATCSTSSCGGSILTVGGGVHAVVSGLTIQDAGSSNQHGGGIDVAGGDLSVTRSTFAHNAVSSFASDGGAISVNSGGTLAVSGSTFDSNSSAYFSGAIGVGVNSSGTATVTTSTFSGNSAGFDGFTLGVGNFYGSGDLTVISSTITGGGAIDLAYNYGGGTVTVAGNIFYGGCAIDPTYLTDAGYNVGTDTSCENGGPDDDSSFPVGGAHGPALGSLANNGGPTRTMILRPSFPANTAIDAIPDATSVTIGGSTVALCPAADQRGVVGTSGPCDAGALQRVGKALRPTVTAINPNSGPVVGGTQVDIIGANFLSGATVVMGQGNGPGSAAIALTDVTVVSSTEITATTPAVLRPGGHKIYVTTAGGTSAPSSNFTYVAGP